MQTQLCHDTRSPACNVGLLLVLRQWLCLLRLLGFLAAHENGASRVQGLVRWLRLSAVISHQQLRPEELTQGLQHRHLVIRPLSSAISNYVLNGYSGCCSTNDKDIRHGSGQA